MIIGFKIDNEKINNNSFSIENTNKYFDIEKNDFQNKNKDRKIYNILEEHKIDNIKISDNKNGLKKEIYKKYNEYNEYNLNKKEKQEEFEDKSENGDLKKIKKSVHKKTKLNVNDIYEKIKIGQKSIEIENKESFSNDIINDIKNIYINKINKYMLMSELYEKLFSNGVDNSKKFRKYIDDNYLNDYFYVFKDNKYSRFYTKCKRLFIIKNYIEIEKLYKLKIMDNFFSLSNKDLNNLICKFDKHKN